MNIRNDGQTTNAQAHTLAGLFIRREITEADPVLDGLAPEQRRYVRAIASMSYDQIAAAFGTGNPTQAPAAHR
jgi:hypothetical protein